MRRRRPGLAALVGLVAGLVLASAGPAMADVGVSPSSEPAGGSGTLTFRVTDPVADAGTTRLELDLPTDHPLLGVVAAPKFGWDLAIERSPIPGPTAGRVTRIIWNARSTTTSIQPGRYGTFSISVRQFPSDASLVRIQALQTWSNGAVVAWADPLVPGSATPPHPAPEVTLTGAGGAARSAVGATSASAPASQTPSASQTPTAAQTPTASQTPSAESTTSIVDLPPESSGPSSAQVHTALGMAGGAIALALLALAMSSAALNRRRADRDGPSST